MTGEQTKGDSDNIIFTDMNTALSILLPNRGRVHKGRMGRGGLTSIIYISMNSEVIREIGSVRNTVSLCHRLIDSVLYQGMW